MRSLKPSTLLLLVGLCCVAAAVGALRLGAFNVQVFGPTKAGKQPVISALAQIIRRYDIILIQEIRDSQSNTSLKILLDAVNANRSGPNVYQAAASRPLGRSHSKEQYAFLYRLVPGLTLINSSLFPDTRDEFEREPYAVKFRSTLTGGLRDLVLVGVHIDPNNVSQELGALEGVWRHFHAVWGTDAILMMGDMNAGCDYLSKRALAALALRRNASFTWLINDTADTTTKSTVCAYDRLIASGAALLSAVVPGSAQVYRFDTALCLTPNETIAVSDHYPVEVELGGQGAGGPARRRRPGAGSPQQPAVACAATRLRPIG